MSIIPYIDRSTDLLQLTIDYPLNGALVVSGTKFRWFANSFAGPYPVHFNVEIATDSNYNSLVKDSLSRTDFSHYEYETAPNVWSSFPSTGLTSAQYNARVRYDPGSLTNGVYYWRVRIDQIY